MSEEQPKRISARKRKQKSEEAQVSYTLPEQWSGTKVETRAVSDLRPYERNARKHDKHQVAKIAESIRHWGWTTPVLISEKNEIIAGHGRIAAAELLGITAVPVIVAKGWTDAQRRAYVIADNQIALEAGWDRKLLATELFAIREIGFDLKLTGFEVPELRSILREPDLVDDTDKVPPLPEFATTRPGDLWIMGKHRLICADATKAETFDKLMQGETPDLMVTDPPYGVNYDPQWRREVAVSKPGRIGKVHNDERADWTEVWKLYKGNVAYVWHAALRSPEFLISLETAGLNVRSQIIWSKRGRYPISRGHYHWAHEPCWYAVREGSGAKWIGGRQQTTIWEIDPPSAHNEDKTQHSTQKPVECMARAIRNHDAPLVFDPFMGSGTTLIAAHLQDRTCFGMELEPKYVDIAVRRWQNHSGMPAVLEGDGRTFDEVLKQRHSEASKKRRPKKGKETT